MIRFLRRIVLGALCLTAGVGLTGCSNLVSTTDNPPNPNPPGPPAIISGAQNITVPQPVFDPANGLIPLPNSLLQDPTTGLINQFPKTPQFTGEPFTSLATLNGWSTSANILIPFVGGIDPTTVNGQSVIVLDTKTNLNVNMTYTVTSPQTANATLNSTVVLSPVRPLNPQTTHIVVVTGNVTGQGGAISSNQVTTLTKTPFPLVDASGHSTLTGLTDSQAQQLEPLRLAYQPIWAAAEKVTGTGRANIPFAFSFSTQSEFSTLQALHQVAVSQNVGVSNGTAVVCNSTAQVQGFYNSTLSLPATSAANIGRIFEGNITMPDYIGNATTGSFQGDGSANNPVQVQSTRPVPFWALFPDPAVAPGPRPCVIFQHGITRTRNDVFAVASAICSSGFGVIAIDLVDHGNLDPVPVTSPSPETGTIFINLASPRTERDNLRQSVVDLFYVTQAVVSGQTNLDGTGPAFAKSPPMYLGHSLGSIVGAVYAAIENNNQYAVLNVGGARLSALLLNSATFAPIINAGLAQNGLTPGTAAYSQFIMFIQAIADDGDPFNYADHLQSGDLKGGQGTTAMIQEVINDQVVPNSATADLANSLLCSQVSPVLLPLPLLAQVNPPFVGSGIFQYANAQHGAILTPTQGPTVAIQTQALNFLSTGFNSMMATIIDTLPTTASTTNTTTRLEPDPTDYRHTVYTGK